MKSNKLWQQIALVVALCGFVVWLMFYGPLRMKSTDEKSMSTSFNEVQQVVRTNPSSVSSITFVKDSDGAVQRVELRLVNGDKFNTSVPGEAGSSLLLVDATNAGVRVHAQDYKESFLGKAGRWVVPIMMPAILIAVLIAIHRSQKKMLGGEGDRQDKLRKAQAKEKDPNAARVTFADVAGAQEAKEALEDTVNYLRDPAKFQEIGARARKGILLIGPPGNGKTLIAKAVAGEANAAFFSMAGSDFVEMFVGVGAARVRSLFEQAREKKPCIVFIDEIDAVGRQRGTGVGHTNDERESTLNQLLVELDGFLGNEGVVLLAATNRPDVLDPALLRPGRFDLQVPVDQPDMNARLEILKIHTRNKRLANPGSDLPQIARRTPGFSGAQLEGVCNEAALLAVREGRRSITLADLDEGIDRVQAGPAKKALSKVLTAEDIHNTAVHEVGHGLVSQVLFKRGAGGNRVSKITVLPRARALGFTESVPERDQFNYTDDQLLARIAVSLGGRLAQKLFLGVIDTGAANDFEQAYMLARRMVTEWGMSPLGPISLGSPTDPFMGRALASGQSGVSEETARQIDAAVREILSRGEQLADEILQSNAKVFERIVDELTKRETLLSEDWDRLCAQLDIGGGPGISTDATTGGARRRTATRKS